MLPRLLGIGLVCWLIADGPVRADENWPQFRGLHGAGLSDPAKPGPVEFGPDKNVIWKTPVPSGLSSPCIWGDRIFITACHHDEKKLETLCINRDDGRVLWRSDVGVEKLEQVHKTSNPANATPVCDGERVYVYFASYGLLAYSMEGTKTWEMKLPMANVMFGSGTSPVLIGNLLVLNRLQSMAFPGFGKKSEDNEKRSASEILAVDRKRGNVAWREPIMMGPGGRSHSTPAVIADPKGEQVIVAAAGRINGLSVADGKLKWWADGLPMVATATPLVLNDRLYLNCTGLAGDTDPVPAMKFDDALKQWDKDNDGKLQSSEIPEELALFTRHREDREGDFSVKTFFFRGADTNRDGALSAEEWNAMWQNVQKNWAERMKPATVAVRLGGEGNVTKTHLEWSVHKGVPEVPSMLAVGPHLYAIRNGGLLTCLAIDTGKVIYEERLGASGSYYASPISDGQKVYLVSQPGIMTIVRTGEKFERLARIDLQDEVGATPALVGGRLYVRTGKHLMAFK